MMFFVILTLEIVLLPIVMPYLMRYKAATSTLDEIHETEYEEWKVN